MRLVFSTLVLAASAVAVSAQEPLHISATQTAQGLTAEITSSAQHETLQLTVCGDSVIHVVATPALASHTAKPQPWMLPPATACPGAPFTVAESADATVLSTNSLRITFAHKGGNLTFRTADGHTLLNEWGDVPRTYDPVQRSEGASYQITDRFSPDTTEAFYGLGQHQSGMFNYRGSTVKLAQNNTDVAIPLLVSSNGYALLWNTAAYSEFDNRFPMELHLTAMAGDAVDYYFLYGPAMDALMHDYRGLTGHAPLLPEWAFGFWQSKDRYNTQKELLEVAARYRAEHIPIDAIVQDWFWWKDKGDPVFNAGYPDVPAAVKTLHDEHLHAMISVWALMDKGSKNLEALEQQHLDVPGAQIYDATNPAARDFYWKNLAGPIFAQGWDAFWLDSSEPEEIRPHSGDAALFNRELAIGSGSEYTNVYPLMHNRNIYDHWLATTKDKRVTILTRSAFMGQQRTGAIVWSGDVFQSWWALRRQVSAGLNFALSGYPYWTTDIGGYHPLDWNHPEITPAYQRLYARWFEYGVFCPVFRTHGHRPANELWAYPDVEPILLDYDKLRYRLLPYIYSLGWKVEREDSTIMRPLVMDWRTDPKVHDLWDEFLFGPAILVAPVLEDGATKRDVYLPAGNWYDFWTNRKLTGGQTITANAPLETIPLYVRAGSILPMGPDVEWATQKPEGPLELRIYPGADATFTLYSDAGDGYGYQSGEHATAALTWNDQAQTLTIGARSGSFPSMPQHITMHVHRMSDNAEQTVEYSGEEEVVRLNR